MVTEIANGGCYFCTEINELHFPVTGPNLIVTLEVGGVKLLHEKYVPAGVDNRVSLYDIGDLIRQFMVLNDPAQDKAVSLDPTEVTLTTSDAAGVRRVIFKCFYARRLMSCTQVMPLLLTHEGERKTAAGRREWISYICDKSSSIKVMVAYHQGELMRYQQAFEHVPMAAMGRLYTFDVSLDTVSAAAAVAVDAIEYYEVYLYVNGSKADKMRFINDRCYYRNMTEWLYLDAWGAPKTITLTGLTEYAPELLGEVVTMTNRLARLDSRLEDVRTVNSGYMDKSKYQCLVDMVTSPYLYLREEGAWVPVVIEEVDMSHRDIRSEKINVRFTVRKAGKTHQGFDRVSAVRPGVFDKSFDISFD